MFAGRQGGQYWSFLQNILFPISGGLEYDRKKIIVHYNFQDLVQRAETYQSSMGFICKRFSIEKCNSKLKILLNFRFYIYIYISVFRECTINDISKLKI